MKRWLIIAIVFIVFCLLYLYSAELAILFYTSTGITIPYLVTPQSVAKSKEGTTETSNNYVPWLHDWFFGVPNHAAAWCMIAISYCYSVAGNTLKGGDTINGFSSIPAFYNAYSTYSTSTPVPGDIVIYNFDGGLPDHGGIFIKDNGDGTFVCSEGNYSNSWQSVTHQFGTGITFIHLP